MTTKRAFKESPSVQGADEIIAYRLTTTPWGSSPTAVNVVVYDVTDPTVAWVNVTSTVMPTNTPTVSGDVITLSPLKLLTDGKVYRIEIRFTCSGNTFEAYGIIAGGE